MPGDEVSGVATKAVVYPPTAMTIVTGSFRLEIGWRKQHERGAGASGDRA